MAKDIYSTLGSVNSSTKARRQLQPESDMGKKERKSGGDRSYGMGNMGGGISNKKKSGRYKGLA